MQRYFIQPNQFNDQSVTIIGDDVHHITKVLRSKAGDQIICCDGLGKDALVKIDRIESDMIIGTVVSLIKDTRESDINVIIAQALPKADKMDLIIQKGTEIGVRSFIPFTSERTIVQLNEKKEQKRIERWMKIAKEAAEQAHRSVIPDILPVINWKQLLNKIANDNIKTLIAYEQEDTKSLYEALEQNSEAKTILLVIGPEGGFTEKEIETATEMGAISISLGKRILRTETAGLVGAANIIYHLERG